MNSPFLWLSGADTDVLQHCPRERAKFVAMGGTVLTTSVLGAIAATFLIGNFLHIPLLPALLAGIGWGFAIMNLDRWLLISIRRQDTPWKTVGMALPRVFLALVVGAVIAVPLELQVFEPEVQAQAERDKQAALAEGRDELRDQYRSIEDLQGKREELQESLASSGDGGILIEAPSYQQAVQRLKALEAKEAEAAQAAICELEGKCGTTKPGSGPVYSAKKALAEELKARVAAQRNQVRAIRSGLLSSEGHDLAKEHDFARSELQHVKSQLRPLRKKRQQADERLTEAYEEPIGLLDRVEALDHLATEHAALQGVRIILFLFILAVDAMPALAKLLMSLGRPSLYEQVQNGLEEADADGVDQQVSARKSANEISAGIIVSEEMTRKKFAEEVQEDLLKQAMEVVREAGEAFLVSWRKAVMADVDRQVKAQLRQAGLDPGEEGEAPNGHRPT